MRSKRTSSFKMPSKTRSKRNFGPQYCPQDVQVGPQDAIPDALKAQVCHGAIKGVSLKDADLHSELLPARAAVRL